MMIGNFKAHFKVEKPPYFLVCTRATDNTISMEMASPTIVGSWEEVFYGLMSLSTNDITLSLPFALVSCMSQVARQSRRGFANTLFVHPEMALKITETFPEHLKETNLVCMHDFNPDLILSCYHKTKVQFPTKTNEIRPLLLGPLKVKEVRQAQQKFNDDYREGATIVDGPFAVFNDVLYLNPNWKTYFYKARLIRD
jgi:hypothetical protein